MVKNIDIISANSRINLIIESFSIIVILNEYIAKD